MTDKDTGYDPVTFKYLTFHDKVPAFRDGSDTPRAYLEHCLETIEAREPIVKAWASLRIEGARADADASTARYKAGRPLSNIDGMPIGVKDLISTNDLPTNLGIANYENNSGDDSACMQAFRAAGGVHLGKTTTTEMGMADPGPTTNPFDRTRTPGGSSSGSGAVISAQMVPAAIGSQVMGSLLRPSSYNANFSLRPSVGGLHRGERLHYSHAVIGVHAGSLADMWQLTIEIAKRSGGDPGYPGVYGQDELSSPIRPTALAFVETEGWKVTDDATLASFEKILDQLSAAGIKIVTRKEDPVIQRFEDSIANATALSRKIIEWEGGWFLENTFAKLDHLLHDSARRQLVGSRKLTLADYRNALLMRDEARARQAALAPYYDAVITLGSPGPAPLMVAPANSKPNVRYGTTGDVAFNVPSSILGAPAVNLPLLAIERMPVGVQIMGQQLRENHVTGVSRWIYESVRPVSA